MTREGLPTLKLLPSVNGDFNNSDRRTKNAKDPEEEQDFVTKAYGDANYI